MAQTNCDSIIAKRIVEGSQTALLIPVILNYGEYIVGDVIAVREPFRFDDDGDIHYRADAPNPKLFAWKPSIFLKKEHVRLVVKVNYSQKIRIHDLKDEDVQFLGHQTREEVFREWNRNLDKGKRISMGVKNNPEVYLVKFSKISLDIKREV